MYACHHSMLLRLGAKAFYFLIIFVFACVMVALTFFSFSVIDQKYTYQNKVRRYPLTMVNGSYDITYSATNGEPSLIYILQWTDPNMPPFDYLKRGREAFVEAKCEYNNCYVTSDKKFLRSLTDFQVIIFNGKSITDIKPNALPQQRSWKQKYIYGAIESSHYYPMCFEYLDNYFNWTYTYRIDSDFRWGYVTVYDLEDNIIGPQINMTWPHQMDPINHEVKEILKTKSKAAAWFVSNCNYVLSGRNEFVRKLQNELKKYKLYVDIYGHCGPLKCSKSSSNVCNDIIKRDYYFYLSFENSFAEDYITEKLITALNNYAVPIVFGAANYSRFLPPGSYLNARELGVQKLAESMNNIINNRNVYYDFFRWRNHFKFKETTAEDVCTLCKILNDKEKMKNVTIVKNLRSWWNDALGVQKCNK